MRLKNILLSFCLRTSRFWLNDEIYLRVIYYLINGRKLNLKNPKLFSEKIQWLKLYNRKPEYSTMVDKYAVKKYVADIIGEEFIIPTLGVWDRPEDIEWDILPNQFVLKTTHGGGNMGVVICKDKSLLDKKKAIEKLNDSLNIDLYKKWREWPYKNVPKRIIAEKYIETTPEIKDLPDYKWYCFNGEPKFCQVIQGRSSKESIDFFDAEWNHQDFIGLNPASGPVFEGALVPPSKPKDLDTQIRISRVLSKEIPFSRIDLYNVGDNTYFGEITFYPLSGMGGFHPEEYNDILGKMITLPGVKRGGVIIKFTIDGDIDISFPDLLDYKFFCFNGEVKLFKIDFNRQTDHHANYYDCQGHLLPFGEKNYLPQPEKKMEIPKELGKMKQLAETLAKNLVFARIDLYNLRGKIFFGEITFFPASGLGTFRPEVYDKILGNLIELPKI